MQRVNFEICFQPAATADVAAVVMHEGFANVCLLTSAMTIVKAKIDMQVGGCLNGVDLANV